MLIMEMSNDTKIACLRAVPKAIITFLMIGMLYSAQTAVLGIGMLFCILFGSDDGPFHPSIDFFIFICIAMRSKHIEETYGPQESAFDISLICLASFYWVINDILRVALLGAWLPYQYLGIDDNKCWMYLALAAMVPMFPHLWLSIRRAWPMVLSMLLKSVEKSLSTSRTYIGKAREAAFPRPSPALTMSPLVVLHDVEPSAEPKSVVVDDSALTVSSLFILGNIKPSPEPKSQMADNSAQTEPSAELKSKTVDNSVKTESPITTGSGTEWEKHLQTEPRHSSVEILPQDIEIHKPKCYVHPPSRVRKQMLRDAARKRSPTKVDLPVASTPPRVQSVMFTPISTPDPPILASEIYSSSPAPTDEEISAAVSSFKLTTLPALTAMALQSSASPIVPATSPVPEPSTPLEHASPTVLVPAAESWEDSVAFTPAPESLKPLPTPAVDTILAHPSSPEPAPLSIAISVPVEQDISASPAPIPEVSTCTPTPELPVSLPVPAETAIPVQLSSLELTPMFISLPVTEVWDISIILAPVSEVSTPVLALESPVSSPVPADTTIPTPQPSLESASESISVLEPVPPDLSDAPATILESFSSFSVPTLDAIPEASISATASTSDPVTVPSLLLSPVAEDILVCPAPEPESSVPIAESTATHIQVSPDSTAAHIQESSVLPLASTIGFAPGPSSSFSNIAQDVSAWPAPEQELPASPFVSTVDTTPESIPATATTIGSTLVPPSELLPATQNISVSPAPEPEVPVYLPVSTIDPTPEPYLSPPSSTVGVFSGPSSTFLDVSQDISGWPSPGSELHASLPVSTIEPIRESSFSPAETTINPVSQSCLLPPTITFNPPQQPSSSFLHVAQNTWDWAAPELALCAAPPASNFGRMSESLAAPKSSATPPASICGRMSESSAAQFISAPSPFPGSSSSPSYFDRDLSSVLMPEPAAQDFFAVPPPTSELADSLPVSTADESSVWQHTSANNLFPVPSSALFAPAPPPAPTSEPAAQDMWFTPAHISETLASPSTPAVDSRPESHIPPPSTPKKEYSIPAPPSPSSSLFSSPPASWADPTEFPYSLDPEADSHEPNPALASQDVPAASAQAPESLADAMVDTVMTSSCVDLASLPAPGFGSTAQENPAFTFSMPTPGPDPAFRSEEYSDEMEVDRVPFLEDHSETPHPDTDQPMHDTPPLITPEMTPDDTCDDRCSTVSAMSSLFGRVDGVDGVDEMALDEEAPVPITIPESPEVIMREKYDYEEEEEEEQDESEEEMSDVPYFPYLPPVTPAAHTRFPQSTPSTTSGLRRTPLVMPIMTNRAPSLAEPQLHGLTPLVTPIIESEAPSQDEIEPQLNRRFVVNNAPTGSDCNIHALDPDYKEPRKLDVQPRLKEIATGAVEEMDGCRRKLCWALREWPALDEMSVVQLEELMKTAAEDADEAYKVIKQQIDDANAKRLQEKKEKLATDFTQRKGREREQGACVFMPKKKKKLVKRR